MFQSRWTIIREHVDPSQSYHDALPDDGPVGPKRVGVINL